jgi:predicted Zn-dependent protease
MKKHFLRNIAATFVLTLIASFTAGCAANNIYSKADDVKLGQQMQAQIAADQKDYPVLNNAAVTNYCQGIVNTILTSPNIKNKDFNYHVTVINDPKTINAFSIPGGSIYVYTGLLKFIDNEATLAGILGHEMTHADHRHATQQMTQQAEMQQIGNLLLSQTNASATSGQVASAAAGIGAYLGMMRFSRDDERDADATSFNDLMTIPGRPWYPAAIKYFMVKTLSWDPKGTMGSLQGYVATHPPSKERLDNVNKQASDAHLADPTETTLRTAELSRIKAMLP